MDLVARLSYLFGTEEAVSQRRQLVLVREKTWTASEVTVICRGSLGDGVAYPLPDDDIMTCHKDSDQLVYDNEAVATQQHALLMIPSLYSPGFCFIQNTNRTLFSSRIFRLHILQSMSDTTLHGPCLSWASGQFKCTFAISRFCPRWPDMANEWIIRRRRYGWPSCQLVDIIVGGGCHVVPIGNPDSPVCDIEWRMSFSLAERMLIHSFNHVQFLVYNLIRLILKKVIDRRVPNVLCSYFIKTVLFHAVENTTPELWVGGTIGDCYRKCLMLLHHFIEQMNCPNYFVPGNNMMKNKVNADNKPQLLSIIAELMNRGVVGSLLLCERELMALSRSLRPEDIEFKFDKDLFCGFLWIATMREFRELPGKQIGDNIIKSPLLSILSTYKQLSGNCDCSLLNLVFRFIFSSLGFFFIQMATSMRAGNKSSYQNLKRGQRILNTGCNTDISSGRLQLANYMYMTGRYNQCLSVINEVLSKLEPYVMPPQSNYMAVNIYKDIICNNGYSIIYKTRRAYAFDIVFTRSSVVTTPPPVRILLALTRDAITKLPPVIYAYFLQGLCFYHTNDMSSMNTSVALLDDKVRNFRPACLRPIFYGKLLSGYMRMLQKDYRSSCRNFTSAFSVNENIRRKYNQIFDYTLACSVFLACLLNQAFQLR